LGRYYEAEPLYRRALAIAEKNFGPYHQHVASSLNNLAGVLVGLAQYAEAEQLLIRVHEITEKNYGVSNPMTNLSFQNLAEFYEGVGRSEDAEKMRQCSHGSCSEEK
ncbi:MAG: tetratricopeptide repeat protein, partial [Deltaproteobacteria bacterium]|nr:tetratricopeptide repeat protein [Deltaproteobacteria bacterium]